MQQDAIIIFSAKDDNTKEESYDAESLNIEFSNVASTELFGIDLKGTMTTSNTEGEGKRVAPSILATKQFVPMDKESE